LDHCDQCNADVAESDRELVATQESLNTANSIIEAKDQAIKDRDGMIVEIRGQLDATVENEGSLRQKLERCEADIAGARKSLANLNAQAADDVNTITRLRGECDALAAQIHARDATITGLGNRVEIAERECTRARQERDRARSERDDHLKQRDALQAQIDAARPRPKKAKRTKK
jgi:chromosome segregation ATPase